MESHNQAITKAKPGFYFYFYFYFIILVLKKFGGKFSPLGDKNKSSSVSTSQIH
jgi:hypothetical protein